MERFFLSLVALAALTIGGCATGLPLHRGAGNVVIHRELSRVLSARGFHCVDAPDKSSVKCRHAERIDIGAAYLAPSNLLQIWSTFTRDDEALADAWRLGQPCAGVHEALNQVNGETVVSLSCGDEALTLSMVSWIPDRGLSDQDVSDLVDVFTEITAAVVRSHGLLREE